MDRWARIVASDRPSMKPKLRWWTIFGKPAALFEKFPRIDVFIAPKDGP
jgi:hypothetical protein